MPDDVKELTDEEKLLAAFGPVDLGSNKIEEVKSEVEKPLDVEKFESIVNEVRKNPVLPEEELERMFRLQTEVSSRKQRILMLCHASGMDSQQQLRFLTELYRILDWE